MKVGIIGAGMAGLACAEALSARGHDVTLFDKGRGPGGRMSTRRIDTAIGPASFDHGAQYFTVRDPAFGRVVDDWARRGLADRWPAAGAEAWVGVPAMSAVVRDIADRHQTHYAHMIQGIARVGGKWALLGAKRPDALYDSIVVAVPAEQAATILGAHDLAMARRALMARSQPCWTAMFAFAAPLETDRVIVRDRSVIGWAARNNAKPGRDGPDAWVVQAHGGWSSDHIEMPPAHVETILLAELAGALACPIVLPIAAAAHRWLHALSAGSGDRTLWNPDLGIGVCGDWLWGPRVECAWLSGTALAHQMD